MMREPLGALATAEDLVAVLDIEATGTDLFRGTSPASAGGRIFGGLVVAQALVAMTRSVAERPVHSLHGYFMLPGDPAEPIVYAVERMRDGGSFSTRRCVAAQRGRPIFAMSASFHRPEAGGFDHAAPMPDVPHPDALPSREDIRAGRGPDLPEPVRRYLCRESPIDLRPTDAARFVTSERRGPASQAVWMRTAGPLPADPALHAAVLAYMSDMTLLDTALVAHGRSVFDVGIQAASLDHSLWFHRPVKADDWLLYAEDSPSASGSRGFARGGLFDRQGRLVASAAQEGLIRPKRPATAESMSKK